MNNTIKFNKLFYANNKKLKDWQGYFLLGG